MERAIGVGVGVESIDIDRDVGNNDTQEVVGGGRLRSWMVMDIKDLQSNLHGLKRLYGLLKKDGHGTSNTASDLLDEHARLLLKNLLDAATKRVLKLHSEIIASQEEALGMVSPTQLQQPDKSSKEWSSKLSRLPIDAEGGQSCGTKMDSGKDRKLDGLDITLWEETSFSPQRSRAGTVEDSLRSVLASAETRKKRCMICLRDTVKQLESAENTHFYDVAQNSNRFTDLQHQQNNESHRYLLNNERETRSLLSNKTDETKGKKVMQTGPLVSDLNGIAYKGFSSDRMGSDMAKVCNSDIEATSKPEEVDCLSKEASEAIKKIELCISAFHMGADHLHLFEDNSAQHRNCVPETKLDGTVPSFDMSQTEESFMTKNNLLSEFTSQKFMDPVDYPLHQVPIVTVKETDQPYLFLGQTFKLVQPTKAILRQITNGFVRSRGLVRESIEECKFPTKKVIKIDGQNVKAITDNIESGDWIMSRNDVPGRIHNVQKSSVALDLNESSCRAPCERVTFSSASELESPYKSHMAMKDEHSRSRLFQTYKPSGRFMDLNNSENIHSTDSCLNVTSTLGANGKNLLPKAHPGFHENQSYAPQKDGIPKNRHYTSATRTSLQYQDSEGTATDSYSNWRRQQTSSCDSDSEEYSVTDRTRELQYVTSTTSSKTAASFLSHGTGSQCSSNTSNGANEIYSSTSDEAAREITSRGSSKSEGYSSYDKPNHHHARPSYFSMRSTSKKSGPSKTNGINHKKQTGMWKSMKDRLAIIFHHHHHHHHHHHNHDGRGNNQTEMSHNTSLCKAVNFKRPHEAYEEKAVEKTTKSLIHEKDQQNHFHGLMEGFLRHVRNSKQSKPGKETVQLAKGQHGRKKNTSEKSHWWQLLQLHRGAKLPNKTHVKLGMGKKRARLKALPKMK